MIEASHAVSSHQLMQAAGQGTPQLQSTADQFNRLMAHEPDPSIYTEQHLMKGESNASHFVHAQETAMRDMFDQVRAFSTQAPTLDAHELAVRHIEMTYQMAMVQVQFNAGVYVAQSSKNGLQTLMKNQ